MSEAMFELLVSAGKLATATLPWGFKKNSPTRVHGQWTARIVWQCGEKLHVSVLTEMSNYKIGLPFHTMAALLCFYPDAICLHCFQLYVLAAYKTPWIQKFSWCKFFFVLLQVWLLKPSNVEYATWKTVTHSLHTAALLFPGSVQHISSFLVSDRYVLILPLAYNLFKRFLPVSLYNHCMLSMISSLFANLSGDTSFLRVDNSY